MQEKEAISGVTGGYSWNVLEHVMHVLPLVFVPKNSISWESWLKLSMESKHFEIGILTQRSISIERAGTWINE